MYKEGYFFVRFIDEYDRDEIMYLRLYLLNNNFIIMKFWVFDFDFDGEFFGFLLFWVKFYNLLLKCWGVNLLSRIVSVIGIFFLADECILK